METTSNMKTTSNRSRQANSIKPNKPTQNYQTKPNIPNIPYKPTKLNKTYQTNPLKTTKSKYKIQIDKLNWQIQIMLVKEIKQALSPKPEKFKLGTAQLSPNL